MAVYSRSKPPRLFVAIADFSPTNTDWIFLQKQGGKYPLKKVDFGRIICAARKIFVPLSPVWQKNSQQHG